MTTSYKILTAAGRCACVEWHCVALSTATARGSAAPGPHHATQRAGTLRPIGRYLKKPGTRGEGVPGKKGFWPIYPPLRRAAGRRRTLTPENGGRDHPA